jgi:peptidoglycan/LPS O-acetylase OafA/YrhL
MARMDLRTMTRETPDERNRVVDLLRALAILLVVLGHWTAAAVVVRDGELIPNQILNLATWTHPLTWVVQVMPVFFLVGGYANALSWRSARARGGGYAGWLRSRLARLGAPVVPLLVLWLLAVSVAWAAGVPGTTLRTASQVALVPTWFLAAYVMVVALAPPALALWERWGWWAVAAPLALGGLVDLVSIRSGSDLAGFPNYVIVFGAVHMVGFAWLDGRLRGIRIRLLLAAIGGVGTILLVWLGPYPVSMVGLDNAALNNSFPTRVTLGFLGLLQGGLLLAAEGPLSRWLRRPRPWLFTIAVNARIMTLYLWHLTAMVLVIGLSLLLGGFGLRAEPLSSTWWLERPLWWLVLALVTAGFVALFGRFETPRRDERPAPPVWLPILACVGMCAGLGVMALEGIVGRDGVHWWWPLVPIASLLLTAVIPLRPRDPSL